MINNSGAELCAQLLEEYNSIQAAPTYDVNGQSAQVQQAYALYRQGIATLASHAASFQGCGRNGESLGKLDLDTIRPIVARVVATFSQALELSRYAPDASGSPLETAIVQARNAVEDIGGFLDMKVLTYGSLLRAKDAPCNQLLADQAIYDQALEMDVSTQPANFQNAYQLYRQAVDLYRAKVSIGEFCSSETNVINQRVAGEMRPHVSEVGGLLTDALSTLGQ